MNTKKTTPADTEIPPPSAEDAERYSAAFLAALTGFASNPSLGGAKHEELAAAAALRTVESELDRHPALRQDRYVTTLAPKG